MANAAVRIVATQGASYRLRRASIRGKRPSSAIWDSVRTGPANAVMMFWSILNTMNQMAHARAPLPTSGAKVGPSTWARSPASALGPRAPSHTTGSSTK